MIILITGGSGSGKSAFAEEYIGKLSADCSKYYLATMQVVDKEGQDKVTKHRKMREGKGFYTIEQSVSIDEAVGKIRERSEGNNALLLECMSNLVANEMFFRGEVRGAEIVEKKIIRGIEKLVKEARYLVIVTNNVFEDGVVYDETTMTYMRAMGSINNKLSAISDKVIEVVAGIPIILKEGI